MIIGSKIIFVESLPSTNSYASQLLRTNSPSEGTIIRANYQTAGRGQSGNKWESEFGKNLLISIILFPTMINPAGQFIISMALSLGICDFLNRYVSGCTIKWPNDIYINDDKIAGILIENSILDYSIENSITGIGLNINQEKFLSNAPNPVSLKSVTGEDYDLEDCLNKLASDLDKRYKMIISDNFDLLRNEYISRLYRLNEFHNYRDTGGIYTGRILFAADNGRLQIERKSGQMSEYFFKEIEFIP